MAKPRSFQFLLVGRNTVPPFPVSFDNSSVRPVRARAASEVENTVGRILMISAMLGGGRRMALIAWITPLPAYWNPVRGLVGNNYKRCRTYNVNHFKVRIEVDPGPWSYAQPLMLSFA